MGLIPFVKREHAEIARAIERKLLDLPEGSGILFAGVSVDATLNGEVPVFNVWVGCDRSMEEDTINKLVHLTLSEEIVAGTHIRAEVHRGLVRG